MAACAEAWVTPLIGPATRPDPGLAAVFDKTFPLYVEARKALRPVWRGHHAMKREAAHAA